MTARFPFESAENEYTQTHTCASGKGGSLCACPALTIGRWARADLRSGRAVSYPQIWNRSRIRKTPLRLRARCGRQSFRGSVRAFGSEGVSNFRPGKPGSKTSKSYRRDDHWLRYQMASLSMMRAQRQGHQLLTIGDRVLRAFAEIIRYRSPLRMPR